MLRRFDAVIFVPLLLVAYAAEQSGNPALIPLGVDQAASPRQPGDGLLPPASLASWIRWSECEACRTPRIGSE